MEQNRVNNNGVNEGANEQAQTAVQAMPVQGRRKISKKKLALLIGAGVLVTGVTVYCIVKGHKPPVEAVEKIAETATDVATAAV